MDMLRRVKMEYGLSELKWVNANQIFQSESGMKRIRIWKDKQLLQWHIKWRDEISKQSGILLDRMIRTKNGEPFFICDKGWATIHDEIEESYPSKGKEKDWGRLFGTALAFGLKQSDECQRFRKMQDQPLNEIKETISKLKTLDPMAKLVLERSYFEAIKRRRKALDLRERIQINKLPILTPFITLADAKEVFFNLFWVCGEEQPIKGYDPMRKLLEEWYIKNGEASTIDLLNSINNYFSLKGDHGVQLLAECLVPSELGRTVSQLETKTDKETANVMNQFFNSWETSRKLVILLGNWIEEDREKVVAK
ncbi:hypothetical protein H1D32_06955 [Anaerobacillus sp. CMMVII]|uniref:hypothetical protein n=1 Tax=Anaerobacillus sp. CMMVII TaxID=2755588 RepID=UPI0021B7A4D0|nr:hypothetical protein [Anaerobacillus sp. CMMVII]MCT8137504.1 hypothetical protein [Anaerobacillus sp. CMMVII]